ncbi:MAG TPA: NUDIX domain-containing protein [Candidatus Saccharimonadales bacterium]|nr:NUDIX domain-containing protein [Candidatus Saccharimonadales bacterium]
MANELVPTIVVAKALLLDAKGNTLVLRRSATHPTLAHNPDLPGGQVDLGEQPGEACVREILEETGLQMAPKDLKLLYSATELWRGQNWIRLLFAAKLDGTQPPVTLSWEHSEYAWLPPEAVAEIEKQYHGFYNQALTYIRENQLLKAL